jgi:hypothetical protein
MHVIFFLEEPSAEALMNQLLPKILGEKHTFQLLPFMGKSDLLRKLPDRLRAYKRWLPEDHRIVVIVDRDSQDCETLKCELEAAATRAGLVTPAHASKKKPVQVLNRIVVEELESWFFGDIQALHRAYPKVSHTLHKRKKFRDPDAIKGGTWEALERELQRAGYHLSGLSKIKAARDIGPHMKPGDNRSASFQCFLRGLLNLIGQR